MYVIESDEPVAASDWDTVCWEVDDSGLDGLPPGPFSPAKVPTITTVVRAPSADAIKESTEPNGLDSLEPGASEKQPDEPIKKTSMKAVIWLLVILAARNMSGSRTLHESTINRPCLKY